jgi:hypothetical protein
VCCTIVTSLADALNDEHFRARGVFARELKAGTRAISALPVPVADAFRSRENAVGYPELGEGNDLLSR